MEESMQVQRACRWVSVRQIPGKVSAFLKINPGDFNEMVHVIKDHAYVFAQLRRRRLHVNMASLRQCPT